MSRMNPDLTDERMFDRDGVRDQPAFWTALGTHGMVATAQYRATAAGLEILGRGGNAIDAAIACSFALGVCEPAGSGLGGMAMMVVHSAGRGRTVCLDGACRAPVHATPEKVAAGARYTGYTAITVPTQVAVMARAHQLFGSLPLADLMAPAVTLAEDGFLVTRMLRELTTRYQEQLEGTAAGRLFLDRDGLPVPVGTRLRQPALANTLIRLQDAGLEDFYLGAIGREIAEDMEDNRAFLSRADLNRVPWPVERDPVEGSFAGQIVRTLPPPGGGPTLLELLHSIERLPEELLDLDSPNGIVALAKTIQLTRQNRAARYRSGGPMDEIAALSRPEQAEETADTVLRFLEEGETTHVSVMDPAGNAVALTQSIERAFGSKVLTPGLGFLYNGYMKGFKIQRQDHPHYLRPGAVARSNAAPTLLFREGRPCAAIGSTGSERLASGMAQVLIRLRRQAPFEAVEAPRIHVTPKGVVLAEVDRLAADGLEALAARGLRISPLEPYSFQVGGLQLVVRQGERFTGVADPRRDGAPAGPQPRANG